MMQYNRNPEHINDLVNKAQEPDKQTFYQRHPYLVNGIATLSILAASMLPGCTSKGVSAGTKDDIGSKLQKPSIKQLLLEYTVDDHFKDGLREAEGKGFIKGSGEILKGTGKALAFAVPYTARDIAKCVVMLPINLPMSLYKNIEKTMEFLDKKITYGGKLTKTKKAIAFIPAYAGTYVFETGKGFVNKAKKDPGQSTLNLAGAYFGGELLIDWIRTEHKAVAEDLGIYEHRQKDSQREEVAPKKESSGNGQGFD